MGKKNQEIETIRGLTIVLVVAFHSAGEWQNSIGQGCDKYLFMHHFAFTVSVFIMPWLAVVSGYVYSLRPAVKMSFGNFIRSKLRRIILPFLSAVSLMYLFKALAPGVNNPLPLGDIWRAYLFSYDYFWFLQAIFLVFIAVMFLEGFALVRTYRKWQACLIISIVATLLIPGPTFFSIWGFLYLLPFFLLGCGIQRFHTHLFDSKFILLSGAIVLLCLTLQQLVWFGVFDINLSRTGVLGMCSGLSSSLLVFRYRRPIPLFVSIGYFSYAIYLYHGFGQTIGKRMFGLCGFSGESALFLIMTTGGICLPIVFEILIRRFAVLSYLLFGIQIQSKTQSSKLGK